MNNELVNPALLLYTDFIIFPEDFPDFPRFVKQSGQQSLEPGCFAAGKKAQRFGHRDRRPPPGRIQQPGNLARYRRCWVYNTNIRSDDFLD
jgi:hypothetical protein